MVFRETEVTVNYIAGGYELVFVREDPKGMGRYVERVEITQDAADYLVEELTAMIAGPEALA
jgi:hypothetical protein